MELKAKKRLSFRWYKAEKAETIIETKADVSNIGCQTSKSSKNEKYNKRPQRMKIANFGRIEKKTVTLLIEPS